MGDGNGAGPPPPGGVVRNSALSFLACAQSAPEVDDTPAVNNEGNQTDRLVPAGLKALCDSYSRLYPDQPNPLQVTTRLKYWLGGHDPLDYVSMYWNPGIPEENIPPHWHYVSFGLTDLHGDGRVHRTGGPTSGTGNELTFRLAVGPLPADTEGPSAAGAPPLWPAALLQALARYVFTTGNKFCAGDHISWHAALDGSASRVRHLLVAEEPQLRDMETPHGTVGFLQMVGCTSRELRAAQRGSGFEVLKLISEDPNGGGRWLVTRSSRRSVRGARARSGRGAAPLAGVSAPLTWLTWPTQDTEVSPASPSELSPTVEQQIKETLQRGLSTMSTDRTGPEGHTGMSTDSFEMSSIERALPHVPELMQDSFRGQDSVEYLDGVHIILNPEGASLLPLAIDGRVCHGRHFTWRCGPRAVTLLASDVAGAVASPARPYALQGDWLQVVIPKDLAEQMSPQVAALSRLSETDSESEEEGREESPAPHIPLTLCWPRHRLKISVVHDPYIGCV